MKLNKIIIIILLPIIFSTHSQANVSEQHRLNSEKVDQVLMMDIYVHNKTKYVSIWKQQNSIKKELPIMIDYNGKNNCQISCLTPKKKSSIFTNHLNQNVAGMIRVKGFYQGKICKPYGMEQLDLSKNKYLITKCTYLFPESCKGNSCTISANTGRFFGKY